MVRLRAVNRKRRPDRGRLSAGLTLVILVTLVVAALAGQSRLPVTEAGARALARQAARESPGDPTALVLALDRRIREQWGDFESFPLSIISREDLLVTVSAPYLSFRTSLMDVLRTGQPIERAVWTGTIVVAVAPRRLEAADIESVSVSRDGRLVPPVSATLRPMAFSNGAGREGVLHAGDVHFEVSTFSPGSRVVLRLAPRGLEPILYAFSAEELTALR